MQNNNEVSMDLPKRFRSFNEEENKENFLSEETDTIEEPKVEETPIVEPENIEQKEPQMEEPTHDEPQLEEPTVEEPQPEEPKYETIRFLDFLRDYLSNYPYLLSQRIMDFIEDYKGMDLYSTVKVPIDRTEPLTIKYKNGLKKEKEFNISLNELKDKDNNQLGYKVVLSDSKEMWNFDYMNSKREIIFNRQDVNPESKKKPKRILDIKGVISAKGVNASCTLMERESNGEYFTRSIEYVRSFRELKKVVSKHEGVLRFNPTRPTLINMNNNVFTDVPYDTFDPEEFMFPKYIPETPKSTLKDEIKKYFGKYPEILINKVLYYIKNIFNLDLEKECEELKVSALPLVNPKTNEINYEFSLEIPVNGSSINLRWNPEEMVEAKKNPNSKVKPTIKVVNEKRYTAEFSTNQDNNNVEFAIEPTMVKNNAMVFYYPRFEGTINEQNEIAASGQVITTINMKNLQKVNPNLQSRIERMKEINSMERLKEEMLIDPPILIAWYDKIITPNNVDLTENLTGKKL